MPKKTPRKFSCILVACLYYSPKTEYLKIRDHLITNIDTVMRKHPECGVWGQKKKPHSIWLYQPLNGNPYLGLIHVQICINIIKRLFAT